MHHVVEAATPQPGIPVRRLNLSPLSANTLVTPVILVAGLAAVVQSLLFFLNNQNAPRIRSLIPTQDCG